MFSFVSHPSKYAVIPIPKKTKKRNIFINYPVDEQRPLLAHLIVSPLSNSPLINRIPLAVETDAVYQVPLLFGFPKMGKDMSAIALGCYFIIAQWVSGHLILVLYSLVSNR